MENSRLKIPFCSKFFLKGNFEEDYDYDIFDSPIKNSFFRELNSHAVNSSIITNRLLI